MVLLVTQAEVQQGVRATTVAQFQPEMFSSAFV